jgi:16S rRNA (adenine1518-N6/adenine1519-N6)-dimethyltransferase
LIDANIVRKILQAAQVEKEDLVIEIGPGPGSLTEELLKVGCKVVAIEKDPLFAKALNRLNNGACALKVFEHDILTFPLEEFLKKELSSGKKAKVISNLPYHITTPIITRLLPLSSLISSLTLMVQKEFAQRIAAKSGTTEYSSLSLFTQFYADPTYSFTVSPSCFFPKPNVFSAVVHLRVKEPPLPHEKWPAFFRLTRRAFQTRRKMLRSSLKENYSAEALGKSFEECDISPQARPEELSLEQFLSFFHALSREEKDQARKGCDREEEKRDLMSQNLFDFL